MTDKGNPGRKNTPRQQKEEAKFNNEAESPYDAQEPDISVFRPEREGVRKVLGDLEADVMEYVWEHFGRAENSASTQRGFTVREVYEAFRAQQRIMAYTTLMTTMARLARKQLLRVRKVDSAYLYTPSLSKEEFIDSFVSHILENLLVSFSQATELHLKRLSGGVDSAERLSSLKGKVAHLRKGERTKTKMGESPLSSDIETDRQLAQPGEQEV